MTPATIVRISSNIIVINHFRLRHLNLERNEIFYVPQLKSVEGSMVVSEEGNTGKRKKSARSGKKTSRTPRIKPSQHGSKKSDHTIDEATASETHGPQNTEASLPAPANSEVVSDQPDTEVKVEVEVKDEKRGNLFFMWLRYSLIY